MNFLQCNISILFLDSVFMPHLFSRFINLSLWPQNCPLILTDPVILSVHALSVVPELVNSGKCNPIWSAFQTLGIFLAHDVCHIVFSSICCWRIPTYSNFLEQAFSFFFFFFFLWWHFENIVCVKGPPQRTGLYSLNFILYWVTFIML